MVEARGNILGGKEVARSPRKVLTDFKSKTGYPSFRRSLRGIKSKKFSV